MRNEGMFYWLGPAEEPMMIVYGILVCLVGSVLASPDWPQLLERVNNGDDEAPFTAYANWEERPDTFVSGLTSDGVLNFLNVAEAPELLPTLTKEEVRQIGEDTCMAFVKGGLRYLPHLDELSVECRDLIYEKMMASVGWWPMIADLNKIPSSWVGTDGEKMIKAISRHTIGWLSAETFRALVQHEDGALCQYIRIQDLGIVRPEWRTSLTPQCIAKLQDLGTVVLEHSIQMGFPDNCLAFYNGPLHGDTIRYLRGEQVASYGSMLSDVLVCQHLDIQFLDRLSFQKVSGVCLFNALNGTNRGLGASWKNVTAEQLNELPGPIDKLLDKITRDCLRNMQQHTLQAVFESADAIKKLIDQQTLDFNTLRVHSLLNKKILRNILNIDGKKAAEVLERGAFRLPDDIFALCDADAIIELGGNRDVVVDGVRGKGMAVLKKLCYKGNFGEMVRNIGSELDSAKHICTLIPSPESYLRIEWLRPHIISAECRGALPFDTSDSDLLKKAPELYPGDDGWKTVVAAASKMGWGRTKPVFITVIFAMPAFCDALNTIEYCHILGELSKEHLTLIPNSCVYRFKDQITPEMAPKLDFDSFSRFTVTDFANLRLSNLRPAQISYVSAQIPPDAPEQHILSACSKEDLEELSHEQLKAIADDQWDHVRLSEFEKAKLRFPLKLEEYRKSLSEDVMDKESLRLPLSLCTELVNGGDDTCIEQIRAMAISVYTEGLEKSMIEMIPRTVTSIPILRALSRDRDLTDRIVREMILKPAPYEETILHVEHNTEDGFNVQESVEWVMESPQTLPGIHITAEQMAGSGPTNSWVEQMGVVLRDKLTTDDSSDGKSVRKFNWLVGRDAGVFAGAIVGKQLQKRYRLPFPLDEEFYKLIGNPTKEAIEAYYRKHYAEDENDYKKRHLLHGDGPEKFLLEYIRCPPLDNSIRWLTPLFVSSLQDPDDESILDLSNETYDTIIPNYFDKIAPLAINAFGEFVHAFLAELDRYLKVPVCPGISKILAGLLNPASTSAETVLRAIEFDISFDDSMVDSLIPSMPISADGVVRSFIKALTPQQLSKLISVWAGAATVELSPESLIMHIDKVGTEQTVDVRFWRDLPDEIYVEDGQEKPAHIMISSAEEYKSFIREVAKVQHEMLKCEGPVHDPFDPSATTAHDGKVSEAHVSICGKSIRLRKASAGEMLHNLIIILNLSTTDILG